jgi:CRP/FNR family cyclic AMP-dependent transcriptional regulator
MSNKKIYLPLTDIENVIAILNKIAIFGGLSEKQLYSVFKLLKKVSYGKDELIFEQGESASCIYIIQSGKVKLFVESDNAKLELIEFGLGDCFGESSLIGIEAHTANAIAVEKTELIVLSSQALLALYNHDPQTYGLIILNIARETSRRLHKADNTLLHYVMDKKK